MALTVKEAAVNTAADTYLAAIDDLLDGLTAGDKVMFVPIKENRVKASTATDPASGAGAANVTRFQITVRSAEATQTDGGCQYALGGGLVGQVLGFVPWCVKVTNSAGDLT